MEKSTSEIGIFNSYLMHKINRKCKPCIFSQKLKRNLTKYLFDFFYYRELHTICSANLFLYQCFTEYQLMTWKLEMNNIINIFHLDIKNYEEEVDDTLTKCIQKKRTYAMKDHPGCFIRINKEGLNIISIAYYDDLGSMDSITASNKNSVFNPWVKKILEDSYTFNECILINTTSPINFGFSFYHVVKGDYQLYLHHSLINMKNARLILQVTINGNVIYNFSNFPNNNLIEQDNRDEKEKEKNIKLNEYLICSITKKMFEQADLNRKNSEENDENLKIDEEINKCKDYEVRVAFKNQDLFWKAGWCVDGGRLLRKRYEVNESTVNKNFKRFKSENIDIFESVKRHESAEHNEDLKKSISKLNSLQPTK